MGANLSCDVPMFLARTQVHSYHQPASVVHGQSEHLRSGRVWRFVFKNGSFALTCKYTHHFKAVI